MSINEALRLNYEEDFTIVQGAIDNEDSYGEEILGQIEIRLAELCIKHKQACETVLGVGPVDQNQIFFDRKSIYTLYSLYENIIEYFGHIHDYNGLSSDNSTLNVLKEKLGNSDYSINDILTRSDLNSIIGTYNTIYNLGENRPGIKTNGFDSSVTLDGSLDELVFSYKEGREAHALTIHEILGAVHYYLSEYIGLTESNVEELRLLKKELKEELEKCKTEEGYKTLKRMYGER